jgi:4-hydroxyacetophenone monooxygenase
VTGAAAITASEATTGTDLVERAIALADLNALRMALYQATGDPELEMTLERPVGVAGTNGSTLVVRLTDADARTVTRKAAEFLRNGVSDHEVSRPTDRRLRALMGMLRNEVVDDDLFHYGKDALGFDEFPRAAEWTDGRPPIPEGFRVVVIGAGFSGIAAAIQLKRLGIPFTVVERQSDLGGTWQRNTYPDARVDTTNFMYQYTFEKNYPWTEYFARQGEVRDYLRHVADKHGVAGGIRFGADVERAEFDVESARWTLLVRDGSGLHEEHATVIISGAGLFGVPRRLDVPGADRFEGQIIHTTEWHADAQIGGARVAVIGNGSTGVQLLSRIATVAGSVEVFQRTPQWIVPRAHYGELIEPETRWLLDTMPYYANWYIYAMLAEGLGNQVLQEPDPEWQSLGGLINEPNDALRATMTAYIAEQLGDRTDLINAVTPSHAPMARRLIVDNNWYRTLLEPHVRLVTSPVASLTPSGIRTEDGEEHEADVIVTATGFATTRFLAPAEYFGSDGIPLEEVWREDGPRAHLGMTVPGFPNLFILYGPSAQPRSGSTVSIIEQWASYSVQAIVLMLERGGTRIEVRQDVFDEYNAALDAAAEHLIWVDAGSLERNYYVNDKGRSQVNEPWPLTEYYRMIHHPDPLHFDIR